MQNTLGTELAKYMQIEWAARQELAKASAESVASRRASPVCMDRVKRAAINTRAKGLKVDIAAKNTSDKKKGLL